MTIYLDTCALNRLTDDPAPPRILQEAEAIVRIFHHLVTTDDRFLRLAVRKTNNRHPEIINPVDYRQRRYL